MRNHLGLKSFNIALNRITGTPRPKVIDKGYGAPLVMWLRFKSELRNEKRMVDNSEP